LIHLGTIPAGVHQYVTIKGYGKTNNTTIGTNAYVTHIIGGVSTEMRFELIGSESWFIQEHLHPLLDVYN
jgi:hypothetical protein